MPMMSLKQGSLSVSITGISSLKFFSSRLSKYFTTLSESGFLMISIKVKWVSSKINDKMALLSVLMHLVGLVAKH